MAKPPQKRTIILKEHICLSYLVIVSPGLSQNMSLPVQRCIIMHDQNLSSELDFSQ